MTVALLHDFGEVFAHKGFAAGEIYKFEVGERTQVFGFYFFAFICRGLPYIAHLASHRAAVCENNGSVGGFANGHIGCMVFAEIT